MTTPQAPITDGDEQKRRLARLWVGAQPSVSAYIWSCVQDFHVAEDLLQDVAEDVATSFERYDPSRPFVGWALGIARFKVVDHYRKNDRDRHVFLGEPETLESLSKAFEEIYPESTPRREALQFCMDKLPGKSRKALEMRYELDMKPAQIAERTGTSSGVVRVMLTRIRSALSKCVESRLKESGGDHV